MKKCFLLLFPGLLLSFAALTGGIARYRINLTSSMPLGIWKESKAIHRGSCVAACLPPDSEAAQLAIKRRYLPHGQCPGGFAPLLKQIVAIPGDTVTLTDKQVWINEILLRDSRVLSEDSANRPWFHIHEEPIKSRRMNTGSLPQTFPKALTAAISVRFLNPRY